jgi:hypothetical protein
MPCSCLLVNMELLAVEKNGLTIHFQMFNNQIWYALRMVLSIHIINNSNCLFGLALKINFSSKCSVSNSINGHLQLVFNQINYYMYKSLTCHLEVPSSQGGAVLY